MAIVVVVVLASNSSGSSRDINNLLFIAQVGSKTPPPQRYLPLRLDSPEGTPLSSSEDTRHPRREKPPTGLTSS